MLVKCEIFQSVFLVHVTAGNLQNFLHSISTLTKFKNTMVKNDSFVAKRANTGKNKNKRGARGYLLYPGVLRGERIIRTLLLCKLWKEAKEWNFFVAQPAFFGATNSSTKREIYRNFF